MRHLLDQSLGAQSFLNIEHMYNLISKIWKNDGKSKNITKAGAVGLSEATISKVGSSFNLLTLTWFFNTFIIFFHILYTVKILTFILSKLNKY